MHTGLQPQLNSKSLYNFFLKNSMLLLLLKELWKHSNSLLGEKMQQDDAGRRIAVL